MPDCITLTETYGVTKTSGTTTQTIYYGTETITPSYVTVTVYPTTTEQATKTTTVHTATKTKTPATANSTKTGVHRTCEPGDADEKEFTGLKPTHDQSITLYVIAIYLVGIALGWNLIGLRVVLYPFKKMTVAIHETGHLVGCIALSTGVGEYSFSPIAGGIVYTKVGDDQTHEFMPPAALPLGFVMSILIGGVLTFCGFDTLASKIASFIVGLVWLALIISSGFSLDGFLCLCATGLMIGLWWVDHAWGLRFYILFLGVMNSFYVLWDAADDAFFAKLNPCCATLHFVTLELFSPARKCNDPRWRGLCHKPGQGGLTSDFVSSPGFLEQSGPCSTLPSPSSCLSGSSWLGWRRGRRALMRCKSNERREQRVAQGADDWRTLRPRLTGTARPRPFCREYSSPQRADHHPMVCWFAHPVARFLSHRST